mmetsp:Transcript_45356/g.127999  ORF Transcript_45356/g.127999 Transcript_45356/m.127999 type:complete len:213 (-) Transcript_45356:473-1111(-)
MKANKLSAFLVSHPRETSYGAPPTDRCSLSSARPTAVSCHPLSLSSCCLALCSSSSTRCLAARARPASSTAAVKDWMARSANAGRDAAEGSCWPALLPSDFDPATDTSLMTSLPSMSTACPCELRYSSIVVTMSSWACERPLTISCRRFRCCASSRITRRTMLAWAALVRPALSRLGNISGHPWGNSRNATSDKALAHACCTLGEVKWPAGN